MKFTACFFASLLFALSAFADTAASHFKNAESGGLELKSAGKISFGPDGMLLVSDPRSSSVVAIDTEESGPVVKLSSRIENIEGKLAEAAGAESVLIIDMAVNPLSGTSWFAVTRRPGNAPAIMTVAGSGKISVVDLSQKPYVRMNLPTSENAQLRNVTDLAWGGDSVIVAGQSSEEFANKIYQIPAPLEHGVNARFASAETYHVAHKRWETKAPIQSFIPWEEDGDFYVVGAFACTPIAKFPISDIESGSKIKGTSVVELGSGNRPRDMFTYKKGGEEWLVTNTQRFKPNLFGPSKYWAARVKLEYLDADEPTETNENAARRNVNAANGPDARGMEVVEELFGAVLVSQLDNAEVVVLRETDPENAEAPHSLELVTLP
ncbi:MAG: hypothetical protein P1U87_01445 [Verrucomicrobiales bacterium]|nr:hypothetical protein [Verrucomicrobiales bacterium]